MQILDAGSLPHDIVAQHARMTPSAIAVEFEQHTLSYAQLVYRGRQLAEALKAQGCTPGARVGVMMPPGIDSPVIALAIFQLGATYFPIDPEFPKDRINTLVQLAAPTLVICDQFNDQLLPESTSRFWLANVDFAPEQNIESVPLLGSDFNRSLPAFLFFTSGTTGKPKGVLGSYDNLAFYTGSAVARFGMNTNTIMPTIAKFTFSISLFELICPLVAGGRVRLVPRHKIMEPQAMVSLLAEITMLHCGPALMRRIVTHITDGVIAGTDALQLPELQHVSVGGDLVPVELLHTMLRLFPQAEVHVVYGCSEISCMGTSRRYYSDQPPAETLVGTPFTDVGVLIVDEQLRVVDHETKGEVCFYGPGVTLGYLDNPALSDEKYLAWNGRRYYRTGDVGTLTANGELKLLGRKDFQVKVNGIRIELAEVDTQLRRAPYLDNALSMAHRSATGDAVIYAYVESPLSVEQILEARQFLIDEVPSVMHPRAFIHVDRLPLNLNLKVDRNALPKPDEGNILPEGRLSPPETALQKSMLDIWRSVLGIPNMGIDDDFFRFGGTSLASIDIARRMDIELGVALPMNEFLLSPTVRELSENIVHQRHPQEDHHLVPLKPGGREKQLVFIHDGNGDLIPYVTLSKSLHAEVSVYGVAPHSVGKLEITQLSIEELTDYYCSVIESLDLTHGVYLGGLCIGGFLAYCVAAELEKRDVVVNGLFLFDSHYIDASPLPGDTVSASFNNMTQQMAQLTPMNQAGYFVRKVRSYSGYKISEIYRTSVRRFKIASLFLAKKLNLIHHWPLPTPDVDTVLRYAEKKLRLGPWRPKFSGRVTFFKALSTRDDLENREGLEIDDTPYCFFFAGAFLGWDQVIPKERLIKVDVDAGHSTLLIERYVEPVTSEMNRQLAE